MTNTLRGHKSPPCSRNRNLPPPPPLCHSERKCLQAGGGGFVSTMTDNPAGTHEDMVTPNTASHAGRQTHTRLSCHVTCGLNRFDVKIVKKLRNVIRYTLKTLWNTRYFYLLFYFEFLLYHRGTWGLKHSAQKVENSVSD